jgi:hypothetical protein
MSTYPSTLRAISILNPYAMLITEGMKPYEYRPWNTSFRGLCLIQVSASTECEEEFKEFLDAGDVTLAQIKQMRKSIIGFAEMTGTVWDEEYQLWAHRMEKPARFREPIPCPGALNYWTPYPNKPLQSKAFQQAWELIEAGDYRAADPGIYGAYFEDEGLEPLSALQYSIEELEPNSQPRLFIASPDGELTEQLLT